MLKILITGASGLLGRALMAEFRKPAGFDTRGIAFSRPAAGLDRLDLTDAIALQTYVAEIRPDVIIHSAAERRPDVSEKDPSATTRLNVAATRDIARCAARCGAWMIYMSSDYVFDGTTPPYAPDATPNPLNFYGRSKLEGEVAVRETLPDHCILRLPILYGPIEFLDESPATVIYRQVMQSRGKELVLDDWATRYPTYTPDVASVCRQIVEFKVKNSDFPKTVHWSGSEPMTRYTMALAATNLAGMPSDNIIPSKTQVQGAPRPKDSHLDSSLLENLKIGSRTPFLDAFAHVLKPWIDRAAT